MNTSREVKLNDVRFKRKRILEIRNGGGSHHSLIRNGRGGGEGI
ncbi:MAG: hypothetical protein ACTS5F_01325 [Candidatus Hodgkinia cicadicola]